MAEGLNAPWYETRMDSPSRGRATFLDASDPSTRHIRRPRLGSSHGLIVHGWKFARSLRLWIVYAMHVRRGSTVPPARQRFLMPQRDSDGRPTTRGWPL
jgi:hypothetical protein